MAIRRDAREEPWKGVSLGGWLLLEPGPSYPLFSQYPDPKSATGEARCEWDLLKLLETRQGKKGVAKIIRDHRDTFVTEVHFKKIRACGLNAIRLPFGYWVVLGPSPGEPYLGPAIEYLDRAVDWAEECGLQVVLDLHGCPGGESGEAPSGRRQRPSGTWKWKQWRFGQTLKAVSFISKRYCKRRCVTGITVCNEPSNEVPQASLCRYYVQAIQRIRKAGMPASRVAIVLPLFQRDVDPFIEYWQATTRGEHRNICFDVHCYHCFENEFNGKTLAQHLRFCDENADMLRKYPMVVGEWSLALGVATWTTCGDLEETQVQQMFYKKQLEAYKEASHGWFFWNWTDRDNAEWNYQIARAKGCFSGPSRALPKWRGIGEDPLEVELNPCYGNAHVMYGDIVYLRTFYGRYVDGEGTQVLARWADKGLWQEFVFQPPDTALSKSHTGKRLRSGDTVRLQTHSGRFLTVKEENVSARHRAAQIRTEFVLRFDNAEHEEFLRHRSSFYLQSKATSMMLDADADEEGIFVRFEDYGDWQRFAVEKKACARRKRLESQPGARKKRKL